MKIPVGVKVSGIYEIRNIKNGKLYVGSAANIRQRWLEHLSQLRRQKHHSAYLQRSWDTHGEDAFVFSVIELCAKEELIEREQINIDALNPDYNVCKVAGNTLGKKHSEETKRKIADKARGRKVPPRSQEYRDALSARSKGRKLSPEHMAAFQLGRKNRVYTDEQRKNISVKMRELYASGLRSREKSDETRGKIGKAFAKLTDDQVREIRGKRKSGATVKSIAQEYKTNSGTISEICNGKRYKWVN